MGISNEINVDDEAPDGNEIGDDKTEKKSSRENETEDDDDDDDGDEEYDDDPYDEDFILPDDTLQTMAADEKLSSRVWSNIKAQLAAKDNTRAPGFRPKITELGENRYLYCEYEFTGSDETGYKCALCEKRKFGRKRLILLHLREIHMGK